MARRPRRFFVVPRRQARALLSHIWHRHVTAVAVPFSAWFVDFLFPHRCVSCGCAADLLCDGCRASMRHLAPPRCARCGAPTAWPVAACRECSRARVTFSSARSAVAYEGAARALVHAWKERAVRRAAAFVADVVVEHLEPPAADVITHIPPDEGRLLERGHHPPGQLGEELSRRWLVTHQALLARTRHGRRQTELSRGARRRNVRGAFAATEAPPETVLLVDDVYTTGATTSAAAAALIAAGARRVDVVTFARTVG